MACCRATATAHSTECAYDASADNQGGVASRRLGASEPCSPTFSDVPTNNPYYRYIETAVAHGVISGHSDNTFRLGGTATRAASPSSLRNRHIALAAIEQQR